MDTVLPSDAQHELHPWVVMTGACLKRTKPGADGLLRPDKIKRLNVCVGEKSVQRAMLIWDRILKAVDAAKFKARMQKEPLCRTIVVVDGEELSIGLREKSPRSKHVPTAEERARMKRSSFLDRVPKWDHTPSGVLVLTIDYVNQDRTLSNEVQWTDSEKKQRPDIELELVDLVYSYPCFFPANTRAGVPEFSSVSGR